MSPSGRAAARAAAGERLSNRCASNGRASNMYLPNRYVSNRCVSIERAPIRSAWIRSAWTRCAWIRCAWIRCACRRYAWIECTSIGRRSAGLATIPGAASKRATQRVTRLWRRGRDSNPRYPERGTAVFETAPFNHSGTSPRGQADAPRLLSRAFFHAASSTRILPRGFFHAGSCTHVRTCVISRAPSDVHRPSRASPARERCAVYPSLGRRNVNRVWSRHALTLARRMAMLCGRIHLERAGP